MVTWLSIARFGILKTRFLYLLKAVGANNVDTIGVRNVAKSVTRGVTADIAK